MALRIIVADDHQIVREGLRHLLNSQAGIQVVGEATDGRSAVRLARSLQPSVVVMDVNMPDLNGIDATRQILEVSPDTRVIALSASPDKRTVLAMLDAGARGYLLKVNAFEELVNAIHSAMAGQVFLSPQITSYVVEDALQHRQAQEPSVYEALSSRQREILQLLAEGKSTKEIASILDISQKTVDSHKQSMMEKLHLDNLADLVKFAIKEGLITLDS